MQKIVLPAMVLSLMLAVMAAPAVGQDAIATGPEVGTRIPDFKVKDQNGEVRTFTDLKGPDGLLLLFHRSADW